MNDVITSLQNPRIKGLVRLQDKAAERREQGVVVIEGHKEIGLAVEAGLVVREIYRCSALGAPQPATRAPVIEVSRDVFAKIAYRDDSDGLVAIAEAPTRTLDALTGTLFLVVASVEKPGNLGAIVRTADGVGAQVIVCDPRCDPWNPNVVRASVGTIFKVPVVATDSEACRAWLAGNGIAVVAATLEGSVELWDADLRGPTALVLGTEHEGLDAAWVTAAATRVRIPMRGRNDSLNVSVAAAVLAYEALRQRR